MALDFKSKRIEEITQGKESLLIEDDIIQLDAMREAHISKQQLFSVLRKSKVYNVTKVKRLYKESCGEFSLYMEKEEKPGLSAFPPTDEEVHSLQPAAGPVVIACPNCGNTIVARDRNEQKPCPVCQEVEWTQALADFTYRDDTDTMQPEQIHLNNY